MVIEISFLGELSIKMSRLKFLKTARCVMKIRLPVMANNPDLAYYSSDTEASIQGY